MKLRHVEGDPACLLPPHAPICAPTSSYGCFFSFFLSNLIISPLDFKGVGPGLILFQSNQATYAGARMDARGGSRQVSSAHAADPCIVLNCAIWSNKEDCTHYLSHGCKLLFRFFFQTLAS